MFRWFRSWLERRRMRGRGLYGFWSPAEARWCWVDPLQAYRRFTANPAIVPERHFPMAERGIEPETSELLDAIADAFAVKRFDGRCGFTDAELLNLWGDFGAWLDAQKKTSSRGPTSPEPTESESWIYPEAPAEATPPFSGSGSASSGKSCDSPGESSAEPEPRSST